VKEWVLMLDPNGAEYDRLRCEALWVLQSHHSVDLGLLRAVLNSQDFHARAAAMHLVADEREYLPESLELLSAGVRDEHPRVRLEAVRGLSFFPSKEAADAALLALNSPLDSWLEYTLEHTLEALEPAWTDAYQKGIIAQQNPRAQDFITRYIERLRPGLAAQGYLKVLINPESPTAARQRSYDSLEKLRGNGDAGKAVFRRVCVACHRVQDVGHEFGPNLTEVGKRLKRSDIIESILEPSKKVDPKYITSNVITNEGKTYIGFIANKTADSFTLLMAEGKRAVFKNSDVDQILETKQSSMPENLASVLAPTEFLDVVEYLTTLK